MNFRIVLNHEAYFVVNRCSPDLFKAESLCPKKADNSTQSLLMRKSSHTMHLPDSDVETVQRPSGNQPQLGVQSRMSCNRFKHRSEKLDLCEDKRLYLFEIKPVR